MGPEGEETPMTSGPGDQWHAAAVDRAKSFKAPHNRAVRLARHVEVKPAMRMRVENRVAETLVMDRPVCGQLPEDAGKPFTCHNYLKWFLPPNATLTVVEPDGRQVTYRGAPDR
ncbi:hypothetical protein GCM10022243_07420 [Saccharothrix violaceirubra]